MIKNYKKTIYKVLIFGTIAIIVLMVLGSMGSNSNMQPAVSSPFNDIHQINAQIYGNKNTTDQIPSYLTEESPTGVMPDSMYITVRSPGSSYFTLLINNTVVDNSLGMPMHKFYFSNFTMQYFVSPTINTTFVITVHSNELNNTANSTRLFVYHADVKTPTQFINYMTTQVPKPPVSSISLTDAFFIFAPSAGAGVYVAYELAFFYAKSRRSHPNLADKVIGGMNDEE